MLILDIPCQQMGDKCNLKGFFVPFGHRVGKCTFINKTIKDGDIAPWKDLKKEKRKRNQIRPYFEMGRIVKRLHF